MIEARLTPAHPNAFEPLLNEPCAGAFDHPTAQGQPQRLVRLLVDVIAVPIKIGIHLGQCGPRRGREPLHVQGRGQIGEDPGGRAAAAAREKAV